MEQYKSLYRKWRPKSFDDVVEQEHIKAILKNQIITGKASHAYLFCGTRGTGKTTFAKIFSKAVNCENPKDGNPCNECSACLGIDAGTVIDVVEIDAASNNGVDNIRVIREEVFYLPAEVKKKVYIIDEVHMLSIGAFNALLKTLEEPPAHVIFILATTELHKIPATILSRCQRHDFKRLPSKSIALYIKKVADAENIKIDSDSAELIAKLSGGAMRDALSMLEMCRGTSNDGLTYADVKELLGVGDREKLLEVLDCALEKNTKQALEIFWQMFDNSKGTQNFTAELFELLRDVEIAKIVSEPYDYIDSPKSEVDRIKEIAGKAPKSALLRFSEVIMQTLSDLAKITSNRKTLTEMMIIALCKGEIYTSREETTPVKPKATESQKKSTPSIQENSPDDTDDNFVPFRKVGELKGTLQNKFIAGVFDEVKCYVNETNKIFQIDCFKPFHHLTLTTLPENKKVIQDALKILFKNDYSIIINLKTATLNDNDKGSIQELIGKTEEMNDESQIT